MFPTRARMYLAPISDDETWAERVDFWHNVYGVNMSALLPYAAKCAFEEPMIEMVPSSMQIGREVLIKELDCSTCTVADIPFRADFACQALYTGYVHGMFSWFDVVFEGPTRHVTLSTSPSTGYTHWRHAIFYLDQPVYVQQDDQIRGAITARPEAENHRFIETDLHISFAGQAPIHKHFNMR